VRGLYLHFFRIMSNTEEPKPYMSKKEILYIERFLLGFRGRHIRILEWGSGGSTVYFPRFLNAQGIDYEWTSLEYNKRWYEKVKLDISDNPHVSVKLFDVGNDYLRQRLVNMEEYILYPKILDTMFDLIIVDGRKRRRCLLVAKEKLNEGGLVVLHDAWRSYYHCAFEYFPDRRFVSPTMWRGKLTNPSASEKLLNCIISFYYRVVFTLFIAPVYAAREMYVRHLLRKEERQKSKQG